MSSSEQSGDIINTDKHGEVKLPTNLLPPHSARTAVETPVCRFYSRGLWCRYGRHCRFQHIRSPTTSPYQHPRFSAPRFHQQQNVVNIRSRPPDKNVDSHIRSGIENICVGDGRTLTRHEETKTLEDEVGGVRSPNTSGRNTGKVGIVERQQMKLNELTDEDADVLRKTEIEQLKKRFRGDKLKTTENPYVVTFSPSDPDWPFEVRQIDLEVKFPANYPREICEILVRQDKQMPEILVGYLSKEICNWLHVSHEENVQANRVELIFRPFLRWFDRCVEEMFTAGLKVYQKQLLATRAGLEFVPFAAPSPSPDNDQASGGDEERRGTSSQNVVVKLPSKTAEADVVSYEPARLTSATSTDPGAPPSTSTDPGAPSSTSKPTHVIPGESARRGTEMKWRGFYLSEVVGALACSKVSVLLSCSRCHNTTDTLALGRSPITTTCVKCGQRLAAAYRPVLMHPYNRVMGYLDLQGASLYDVVLMECTFSCTCLNCNKDTPMEGLQVGQRRDVWCRTCHSKLTLLLDSPRYTPLQAKADNISQGLEVVQSRQVRRVKDPAIQEGKPLPDQGACRHYKKSFRWLRFPCCGKAYPCDVCHDEKEDHDMENATRMICGYCAKEQAYSSSRPCVSCNSSVTKMRSTHWEGGKGCRDKISMSKSDKQKYSNISKTTATKKVGEASQANKGKKPAAKK